MLKITLETCFRTTYRRYIHAAKSELKSKWLKQLWNWTPIQIIKQVGDPVLQKKALPVPIDQICSNELHIVINKMIEELRKNDCVGLAAPQIGVSLQIIVMEFKEELKKEFTPEIYKLKQMETLPLTIIINPQMTVINRNINLFQESCASLIGYAAEVPRYQEIQLKGFNQTGQEIIVSLKGWNARIAQHEIDHLEGIMYVDRMNSSTFTRTMKTKK